jgi:two-component system, NarL family, nitrate/nitrite response regulator NarL
MTDAIRIVIADNHVPTRVGVRHALEGTGFVVCGEAGDAETAVEIALKERPDLCLLDVRMPGDGIEAAKAILEALPQTRVVMLTVSTSDEDLFAALEAGASGYLLKGIDPGRLSHALRGVLAEEAAIPRSLAARVVAEFRDRSRRDRNVLFRPSGVTLTNREWEVLDCLAEGMSTAEIARQLFISQTTVRRHIGAILKKLHVPDRDAAVSAVSGSRR